MLKYFKNNIESKKALKKQDCLHFMDKFKQFNSVPWIKIKSFIFNKYKNEMGH